MSIRQRFEERMRKKEQEIRELEGQIREAKAYIQALQDSIKLLPRDETNGTSGGELLRAGSTNAKVYELLKRTGRPIHVGDILDGLGKPNNKKNRLSLSGALGSYVRKKEIFTRPAPNTFGLIETASTKDEPPEDFGLPEGDVDEKRPS